MAENEMGFAHKLWRHVAVRWFGGFHELGRVFVCVHDDGLTVGRDRIIRFDYAFVPPKVYRGVRMTLSTKDTANG